jgi:hypothetical protein
LSSNELSSALINKMANKWLVHIKKTMKTMKAKGTYVKGKGLKQVILAAKKTWHKVKTGGGNGDLVDVPLDDDAPAAAPPAAPPATTGTEVAPNSAANIAGRRRRKTRRRRHSRRR